MIRFFVYAICLIISTFAISGVNFDNIIKRDHIWEARFLSIVIILSLTYTVANLFFDIASISFFN